MKRTLCLIALVALMLPAVPVSAQQAGDNINVLPVVPQFSGEPAVENPNWFTVGDGYLQRQLEATIGASTLNPDHLLAFFNDYRAVDVVGGDIGLGEAEAAALAAALTRTLLALAMGPMVPTIDIAPSMAAAVEAWVGGSRSYDGGNTWSGLFMPGPLWDTSGFSQSMPIYGLEAATDPVLACGPCGYFYVIFVAFTRNDQSKMVVARYRDFNDVEGGDTIRFDGMRVLETGNNAEHGYFLDKPDIEVDVFRVAGVAKAPPGSGDPIDPCAHRVYASYTTFNGLTKEGKIQTKMNFARSEDHGETWTLSKIQQPFNQNQGSAIFVDSRPGMPKETGGGTIYLVWRHFFDPDAMLMTKSTDFGTRWSKVVNLTANQPLVKFDQPTISTEFAPALDAPPLGPALNAGFPELAFRSNAFPTGVVAPHSYDELTGWDATVFVAWQERVGTDPDDLETFGKPLDGGSSRIVMLRSDDEGVTWQGFAPDGTFALERQAIDMFDRNESFDPVIVMPEMVGGMPPPEPPLRASGPQVQPKIAFAPGDPGQVLLAFYESRGRIAEYGTETEYIESDPALVDDFTPFISGYDRVVDFRATLLDPTNGRRISSAQVSRYPLKAGADLSDGSQDLVDVAPVNPPCSPDFDDSILYPGPHPPCVRQINRVNAPTSAVGSSPFIGDYPDAVPFVQFVLDDGQWRWAIEPGDVPSRGFHTVWSDNRHLIPPTEAPEAPVAKLAEGEPAEWDLYPFYGPPGIGRPCFNPGSRNTDVLTSRVDTETIVSAPTTFKQLDAPRSFPFSVSNKTDGFRQFQIDIVTATEYASLSPIDPDQDTYFVEVFPFSSSALTVYVDPPDPGDPPAFDPTVVVGPIRVEVRRATKVCTEVDGEEVCTWESCDEATEDCAVGAITFNADPNNLPLQNLGAGEEESFVPSIGDAFVINYSFDNAFVINGGVDNAFVINEGVDNAFVINEGEENAFVINAFVINAFVINQTIYEVTDTVWEMEASGSNTSANYVPLVNIDNAKQLNGKYAFQLIVDKASSFGTFEGLAGDPCGAYAASVSQQQVLANVVQDPGDPNAFVINDAPENAFVINNQVDNAFVINSSFAMAPSDSVAKSARATAKVNGIDDSDTKADPPSNKVRITLRAFQLVPNEDLPVDPFTHTVIEHDPFNHPPSIVVFHQACDPEEPDPTKQCLARIGADLVIVQNVDGEEPDPQAIDTAPLTAAPCGTVDFPAFTMRNVGNADADPRSGTMRHGVFLSTDDVLDLGVDRLLTDPFADPPQDIRSTINPLAGMNEEPPSGRPYEESFPSTSVTLPPDVTGGRYFLILYVDYPRETSEYDETNNTVAIQLDVEPSFLFHGLQPPTDYTPLTGNAGSAVPLLWQYLDPATELPADSSDAAPSITILGWKSPRACGDGTPDVEVLEDPGSSSLRYDPLLRKWQFNWQTKYGDGTKLPVGCYEISIASALTCESQADGPFTVFLR